VLVVPEAEQLSVANNVIGASPVRSILWVGDTATKGLALISFGDYELEIHQLYDARHRYVVPVEVRGPVSVLLFAVWTLPGPDRGYYIEPLLGSLETYATLLDRSGVVWAGDFNQNVQWDTGAGPYRFTNFIHQLAAHDIHSVYHQSRDCCHGSEPDHTFFLHHNPEKGYHIDFVFASASLLSGDPLLEVGDHATWLAKSDHMPIFCTFQRRAGARQCNGRRRAELDPPV